MKKTVMSVTNGSDHEVVGWPNTLNWDRLSAREREVSGLAAKGWTNKEIARDLKVTEGTVKIHLHRVYQKLGLRSRFALAVRARNQRVRKRGGSIQ
jgi:DNA-binding NarL/FixJ family response regulator